MTTDEIPTRRKSKARLHEQAAEMIAWGQLDRVTLDHLAAVYIIYHRRAHRENAKDVDAKRLIAFAHSQFGGDAPAVARYFARVFRRAKEEGRSFPFGLVTSKSFLADFDLDVAKVKSAHRGEPAKDAPAWTEGLAKTRTGDIKRTVANVITILTRDPRWNVLRFNAFTESIITTKVPPWHEDDAPPNLKPGEWTDADTTRLCAWLSREHKVDVGPSMALDAVNVVARRREIHPVRDWLRSLKWDGEERIDTWLSDHAGAKDTAYTRAVGALFLISTVARVERPGCKVDTVPVFIGRQGAGKSRLVRALGGDPWTLETHADIGTKDALQVLRGKWMVEFSELEAVSRAEATRTKAFVSAQTDTYRASYARAARDYPRQCVFVGTTNQETFLKDETGGRRWWPVKLGTIDVDAVIAIRDQLWAEAHVRYRSGAAWHMTDASVLRAAEREQDASYQLDPWEPAVEKWLHEMSEEGKARRRKGVTTARIMRSALHVGEGRMTRADEMRVGAILGRLGWERKRPRVDGERVYRYYPTAKALHASGDKAGEATVGQAPRRKKKGIPSLALPALPDPCVHARERDRDPETLTVSRDPVGQVGQVGPPRSTLRVLRGGAS